MSTEQPTRAVGGSGRIESLVLPDLHSLQSDAMALGALQGVHPQASRWSLYTAAAKIAASARQAVSFDVSARTATSAVAPLLLYYGCLHWMKTLLYLSDLSWPTSPSMLQHGVSVRRAKRRDYSLALESLFVYREGVLQSFCTSLCPDLVLPRRFTVGHLLGSIPTVAPTLATTHPEFLHVYKLARQQGDADQVEWLVPRRVAANRKLTPAEWIHAYTAAADEMGGDSVRADAMEKQEQQRDHRTELQRAELQRAELQREHRTELQRAEQQEEEQELQSEHRTELQSEEREPAGWLQLPSDPTTHPWYCGANCLADGTAWPLWLCHFVTLYSLSTLCRYNAIEWSDILHWNNDTDAWLTRRYLESVRPFPELAGADGPLQGGHLPREAPARRATTANSRARRES